MKQKIAPSLMCTNLMNVAEDIRQLDEANVDFYHIDVMDGQFVQNFSLSPDFVKQVRALTDKPLDIHIMAKEPEKFIKLFKEAGADMISVHCEATTHLHRVLSQIKSLGLKVGVAINPATPLSELDYVLDLIDYVCLMTVNPGFAGQKFIPAMYDKISELNKKIKSSGREIEIEVDGNIGDITIPKCKELGASMYICGTSAIYRSTGSLNENVQKTKALLK
ncbi:ribulose-phosphate 3-epimerase [Streptococcus anginosus]|nr:MULTISPECIES: ribulose-phosphate 3-epimerase [Streptococcus]KAA9261342.1 ribulose-phosphate 3-epimerase [Streptococcus anginosus]KAA9262303.1 ribulose-phosphate 3-epimerase [Streptococcus anginosus]KAA9270112.1 ribulose-phosphate 3-epimerase [Streptococcus anginosus]KAA9301511.1 ribulose-phosphate 3-epimerase [Streptococcus anginosus]KAA9320862.1 ribulose-phosphate 3-epimerase [Streptococcus anginosus]